MARLKPIYPLGWSPNHATYAAPDLEHALELVTGQKALDWLKTQRWYYKGDKSGNGRINRYLPKEDATGVRDSYSNLPQGAVLLDYATANAIHVAIRKGEHAHDPKAGIKALMQFTKPGTHSAQYLAANGAPLESLPTTKTYKAKLTESVIDEMERLGLEVPESIRAGILDPIEDEAVKELDSAQAPVNEMHLETELAAAFDNATTTI